MLKFEDIEKECNQMEKQWLAYLATKTLTAIYKLGTIYLHLEVFPNGTREYTRLRNTLSFLGAQIATIQISLLWNTLFSFSRLELENLDEGNQQQIAQVKKHIFQDFQVHQHLTCDQLLMASAKYPRAVLVALIRKHLWVMGFQAERDPFKDFSYDLLQSASEENNALYLQSFLKDCTTLPIEDICRLGSQAPEIAEQILMDVQNTQWYFELSSRFAHQYADLRANIANHWQDYLTTFPLSILQKPAIKNLLASLQRNYAEFASVSLFARVKRYYDTVHDEITPQTWQRVGKTLSTGVSLLLWTSYARRDIGMLGVGVARQLPLTCLLPLAYSALAPWIILEVACGLYYLGERYYKHQPQRESAALKP